MDIISLNIPDVKLIKPKKFGDYRGFFMETYNKKILEDTGIFIDFVQDNHSMSASVGTLRGLHYQLPPFAQDKLVRVTKGAVLDVVVDIRKDSPSFGQHIKEILSAENGHQLLIPKGFAHGFITLEPDTEFLYKVSNFYSPECDRNIIWNDPILNINWGCVESNVVLSDKDKIAPFFSNNTELF